MPRQRGGSPGTSGQSSDPVRYKAFPPPSSPSWLLPLPASPAPNTQPWRGTAASALPPWDIEGPLRSQHPAAPSAPAGIVFGITFTHFHHHISSKLQRAALTVFYNCFANGIIPDWLTQPAPPANMSWLLCDLQPLDDKRDLVLAAHDVPLEQRVQAASLLMALTDWSNSLQSSPAGPASHSIGQPPWLPALLTWLRRVVEGRAANPNYLAYAAASGVQQFKRTVAPKHLYEVPHLEHIVIVLVHASLVWHAPVLYPLAWTV